MFILGKLIESYIMNLFNDHTKVIIKPTKMYRNYAITESNCIYFEKLF